MGVSGIVTQCDVTKLPDFAGFHPCALLLCVLHCRVAHKLLCRTCPRSAQMCAASCPMYGDVTLIISPQNRMLRS